ncbi:MAG: tRNA pseudouridine(38-40) synthase TruA [Oscillospiraceae bacterium]|jgi:tRNA pseudouridine38-40 synthase|nr:tRNA pseudouridine(38-40) synthase TruA [Oscillospiraceae bacterium]
MRNLKFITAFNGAGYHGFQRQPELPTIQGEIESALHKILNQSVSITGCSRTDAGVHARSFCFNASVESNIPEENLVRALNTQLPSDIVILSCEETDGNFNARFSAKGKEYVYLVNNKKQRDVFLQAYHYPYALNLELLQETAQLFVGEHDFAAFCRSEGREAVNSTVREIFSFDVKESGGFAELIVRGNGFLYNMVRIMAGTLIYINEGKLSVGDILQAFETGSREKAGKTLPPCGLYLNRVFY